MKRATSPQKDTANSIGLFVAMLLAFGWYVFMCPSAVSQQQPSNSFNLDQTLSDGAQRTTLAFSGLAMFTGNMESQSFFPPGKVADYTGFQYLRDNDPDSMGHNTSFLTRVANNVIYILNDSQFNQLKTLATAQIEQINLYGYKRFPFMKAFRRLLDGDIPTGSPGLNLDAVKQASRELYILDGQISFDRALLYANILNSMDSTQIAHLDSMKGKGWKSWPDITNDQVSSKMRGLPQGTAVAVMTYASDLFSWYAGSVEADVYFCPERHGTYYGSFYIKDAPAIGHEGYSIDEQLTATAGAALSDSSKGYVTQAQAALMSSLVETQKNNLYAGTSNIVQARTQIAELLRGLLTSAASSSDINAQVLSLSSTYGDLDGENNYNYATVFAQMYKTLTASQKTKLADLRKSIMSGSYADGTPFDYSICTTPFLYSSVITDLNLITPYTDNTDYLFLDGTVLAPVAAFTASPTSGTVPLAVNFTNASTGSITSYSWDFGDGSTSSETNPAHNYTSVGTFSVSLTVTGPGGMNTKTQSDLVTVANATDTTKPSVTITQASGQADPADSSPINFTVVFSESVSDFTTGDVTLSGTAGAAAATVSGSGTTYNIAVSGMTQSGTVIASVAAGVASDGEGNVNTASTSTDNTVQYEKPSTTSPTVAINQAEDQADTTGDSPVNFTVVFSEPVSDFATGDVIFGGTAGASAADVSGSGTTYNVAVSGMTTTGTVIVSLTTGVAHDADGNPSAASTSVDNSVQYNKPDTTPPTVTIDKASGQADPTDSSPINFTVLFSESVSGFATGDVTIKGTAGAKTVRVTGSGTTYNVSVSGMTATGTVIVSIAAGVAHDADGNPSAASTSTNNIVQFNKLDNTTLIATINQAADQIDPTSSSSINFTVVFSESVSDFATGDVTLAGTSGATTATMTGSGTTYNISVSGMTRTGTVTASLAAGAAHDAAGNPSTASISTDNVVQFNKLNDSVPTVTINQASAQTDPTSGSSINFTVVFSVSVSGFAACDVTLAGTAGAATATITGSGTTYNVAVSGMIQSGTVVASIAAGVAHDESGNSNNASTSTDNTVKYDISGPAITLSFPTEETTFIRNGTALDLKGSASDTSGIEAISCSVNGSAAIFCTGKTMWEALNLSLNSVDNTITISATDGVGNTTFLNLAVEVIESSPDSAWNGLSMVSLPIVPDLIDPKPVVGFMSDRWLTWNPVNEAYVLYTASQNESWFAPRESTPGRGFWARFDSEVLSPVGLVPSQNNEKTIHLNAGWNLIGTPYMNSVLWDLNKIRVEAGGNTMVLGNAVHTVNAWCWGWDSIKMEYYLVYDTELTPTTHGAIEPWLGYWIKAYTDCDLIFPAP